MENKRNKNDLLEKKVVIRDFVEEDIELITEKHVELYFDEYNFEKESFREYVGDAINEFKNNHNKDEENIWVAEIDGSFAGAIALVKENDELGQLRWFLVESEFRGYGLGNKLMKTLLHFARKREYSQILLWTVSELDAARHLYNKYGFEITETKEHEIWGNFLKEERWDLFL
ncbi:MAG: GNAT family N-acetyltransferase [Bacillota bacterium]